MFWGYLAGPPNRSFAVSSEDVSAALLGDAAMVWSRAGPGRCSVACVSAGDIQDSEAEGGDIVVGGKGKRKDRIVVRILGMCGFCRAEFLVPVMLCRSCIMYLWSSVSEGEGLPLTHMAGFKALKLHSRQ